jgi:hypothetical protein
VLENANRRVVRALCPEIEAGSIEPAMTYPDNAGTRLGLRRLALRDGRWRPQ